MRVTSKGQVTIPIDIRSRLDIDETSEVEFEVVGNVVHLRKVDAAPTRGARILGRLLDAPYAGRTTAELMALTRGEE